MIRIQILNSILWSTQATIQDEVNIPFMLRSVKEQYPNHRVRAVNEDGQLLDMIA
jgi:hypothetical protein